MSSQAQSRVRRQVKVKRSIRLTRAPSLDHPGVAVITMNGVSDAYTVTPIRADQGLGFEVAKQVLEPIDPGHWERREVARYAVLIDGITSSCECPGFSRWGRCKHVEGLQALLNAGKLRHSVESQQGDERPEVPPPSLDPAQPEGACFDCGKPIPANETYCPNCGVI